jgi:hypothetical protein
MTDVALQIAGARVGVRCADAAFAARVRERFLGRAAPFPEPAPGPAAAEVTRNGDVVSVRTGALEGRADLDLGVVETPPSLTLVDFLVRAVVAARLAERGGLLLHAVAVKRPGGVWVAFGRSHAGKSTLGRELGGRVLGDDFVALVPARGKWLVRPTPWWRGHGRSAALSRLIWLVRGEPPSLRDVRGAELCAALWHEAGRFVPGADFATRVLGACADLARLGAVRVAAPEGRVVEAVRSAA